MKEIKTLGALRKTGYKSKSIKLELRDNLIKSLKNKQDVFEGILGYEDTVIPDIQRALLSRHNILLLGLRGQAKTKIARLMINLLDEYIPIVHGSEINDDPFHPISRYAKDQIEEHGDDTPLDWVHRDTRYVEKLATPDVSIADLIGDIDPIKAASKKLAYSDERVLHFGLIPRAHRSIFVINELPDLQPRIQVALFNILQEGDIQIRGFKIRLPLDIQFLFTANPEDYTNRGSIITPLKDRIESQILTHYPTNIEIAKNITNYEARLSDSQRTSIHIPEIVSNILERITFIARDSELVDEKSGVSTRLSISGMENLASSAERRMILNQEKETTARIIDFWGVVPSITGKLELVYEGEQEGPYQVALKILGKAIREEFLVHFPNPNKEERKDKLDAYFQIKDYFSNGKTLDLANDSSFSDFKKLLDQIPGLDILVGKSSINEEDRYAFKELILHGLAEFNILNKEVLGTSMSFSDLLANMLDDIDEGPDFDLDN